MALLSKITRSLMPHSVPDVPATPVYELSNETMMARGAGRECHIHPNNTGHCIKVARHPEQANAHEQNLVEWYCAMTFKRRRIPFRHCARCHGWVATNRGPGLVVERINNDDGQLSPTMQQYVSKFDTPAPQLEKMISELKRWSYQNGIPIVETSADNVLIRSRAGQPHFVLIDGIGGRKVKLKMVLYCRILWFGRLRMRHRWPKQEQTIRNCFTQTR